MIQLISHGSFRNTLDFLNRMKRTGPFGVLHKYGAVGVAALSAATPKEEGQTAASWSYEIVEKPGYFAIHWTYPPVPVP